MEARTLGPHASCEIKSGQGALPSFLWANYLISPSLLAPLCSHRFRVIVEILKPEKPDMSVTLKGLDYIDVLSSSKKDYKLNFFSYKEGLYTAKVSTALGPWRSGPEDDDPGVGREDIPSLILQD